MGSALTPSTKHACEAVNGNEPSWQVLYIVQALEIGFFQKTDYGCSETFTSPESDQSSFFGESVSYE
jgi:hypothetical protein